MAWNATLPQNNSLLINSPGYIRANWEAIALGTDSALLITNAKCASDMALVDTKLAQIVTASKVSGTALTLLPNIPAGAGLIPVANIPVGVTANKILQLDATAKIPAVDASLLTGLLAAQIPNLDAAKIISGLIATARLGSGTPSASNFLRGDQSWATAGVTDHGALTGLTDHDHALYARGKVDNVKIDYGSIAIGGQGTFTITFNFTFASAPIVLLTWQQDTISWNANIWVKTVSTTGATGYHDSVAIGTMNWIAIGTPA